MYKITFYVIFRIPDIFRFGKSKRRGPNLTRSMSTGALNVPQVFEVTDLRPSQGNTLPRANRDDRKLRKSESMCVDDKRRSSYDNGIHS